jgi:hypothetical protein
MARPKGVKQKRDESKYWLPSGVKLKEGQNDYGKDTKLVFIDEEYGEFVSYFKALQLANASTHPKAVSKRRAVTNLEKYGHENARANPEVAAKAKKTMIERYGVENALENPELLKKSRETLFKSHGVSSPMESNTLRKRIKDNNIEKYGVDNPMKVKSIQDKVKKASMDRYGVENPMQSPEIREKMLSTMMKNGTCNSTGEEELRNYVTSLGLECYSGYIGGANPKQLDIKIPEKLFAIEYNGNYWHSEANKNMYPKYHLDKTMATKSQGYDLIHVFEHEWLSRKDQVKSFLKSKLGKNEHFISGRETEVLLVDKKEAREFLDKYHILGACVFEKSYGLYYKGELLSLITIGKHHRNNNNETVLSRYIVKENFSIRGGLSKLVSAALKDHETLTTWVDLRWSTGSNWENLGWEKVSTLSPDYFYYNIKNGKIVSKQSRKKSSVGTPKDVTEHQHALKDGLRRIYDCGKIKFTIKKGSKI